MMFANPGFVEPKLIAVTDNLEVALHAQKRVLTERMVGSEEGAEGK
jgi:hypothetical protein